MNYLRFVLNFISFIVSAS